MKNNKNQQTLSKTKIIKNQTYLHPDRDITHIEELIYYREGTADKLRESLLNDAIGNIWIWGKQGTGKTTITKKITEDLQVPGKIVIYIPCNVLRKESKMITNILDNMRQKEPYFFERYRDIMKQKEGYDGIAHFIKNVGRPIFLVIDEIDQVLPKKEQRERQDPIHSLIRISHLVGEAKYKVIFLTNKTDIQVELTKDVMSSFGEKINFGNYQAPDLQAILLKRAEYCLEKNTYDIYNINLMSKYGTQNYDGDARRTILLLRLSAEIAEKKKLKKINFDIIEEAHKEAERRLLSRDILELSPHEKIFLKAIVDVIYDFKGQEISGTFIGTPEFTPEEAMNRYKEICKVRNWKPQDDRNLYNHLKALLIYKIIYDTKKIQSIGKANYKLYGFKYDVLDTKKMLEEALNLLKEVLKETKK